MPSRLWMPSPARRQSRGAQQAERWGCDHPTGRHSPTASGVSLARPHQCTGTGATLCPPCTSPTPRGDPLARSRESQSTSHKLDRKKRKRRGESGAPGWARIPQVSGLGATPSMGAAPSSGGSVSAIGPSASVCVRVRACMRVCRRRAAIPWWWSVSAGAPCC